MGRVWRKSYLVSVMYGNQVLFRCSLFVKNALEALCIYFPHLSPNVFLI